MKKLLVLTLSIVMLILFVSSVSATEDYVVFDMTTHVNVSSVLDASKLDRGDVTTNKYGLTVTQGVLSWSSLTPLNFLSTLSQVVDNPKDYKYMMVEYIGATSAGYIRADYRFGDNSNYEVLDAALTQSTSAVNVVTYDFSNAINNRFPDQSLHQISFYLSGVNSGASYTIRQVGFFKDAATYNA